MRQLNRNKLEDKVIFVIPLESDSNVMGLLQPLSKGVSDDVYTDYYFSVTKAETLIMPVGSAIYEAQDEGRFVLLSKDDIQLDGDVLKDGIGVWSRRSGPIYISKTVEVAGGTDGFVENFITGETSSKFTFIKRSFANSVVIINKVVTIRGTDIKAVVTKDDPDEKWYVMYVEDAIALGGYAYQPINNNDLSIEYKDLNGVTTYKYKPRSELDYPSPSAFILKYWGIIDEPKLESNLFINRGINNVFESVKRLKTVTNIKELEKTGFGFFKIYKEEII